MLRQFLRVRRSFEIFRNIRIGPGPREDDSYWEMWGNHITPLKFGGMMQRTMKQITIRKMATLS